MNYVDLWIDAQARRLVNSAGSWISEPPVLVRGDDLLLRIRFVDVDRSTSTPVVSARAFEAGTEFNLAGKATFGGAVLVLAQDATAWNQSGDWGGESGVDLAEGRCSCRIDLNSAELASAISSEDSLDVWFDIDCIDPAGAVTTLWRLKIAVWNDVHVGNEGDPAPAEPTYPTTETLDARIAQGIELRIEGDRVAIYLNDVRRGLL